MPTKKGKGTKANHTDPQEHLYDFEGMLARMQAGFERRNAERKKKAKENAYQPKGVLPPGRFKVRWSLKDTGDRDREFYYPRPVLTEVVGTLYHEVETYDIGYAFPERKKEMEALEVERDKKREEDRKKKSSDADESRSESDSEKSKPAKDSTEGPRMSPSFDPWSDVLPGKYRIGKMKATKFNLNVEGVDWVEAADSITQEVYEAACMFRALQNHGDGFDAENEDEDDYVERQDFTGNEVGDANEITQGSPLYIHSMVIDEKYRGLGLGYLLLNQAIYTISGQMSLIFLQPWSMTSELPYPKSRSAQDIAAYEEESMQAHHTLVKYYERAGFQCLQSKYEEKERPRRRVKRIAWMGLWNGYVTPQVEDYCPHLFK